MLRKPKHGLALLTIDEFTFTTSYLTDIPNDFINAFEIALEKNISTAVSLDGEKEGECVILFNTYNNTVSAIHNEINFEDRIETVFWDRDILSLAKEFISDIEENIDDWNSWMCEESTIVDLSNLKNIIKEKEETAD